MANNEGFFDGFATNAKQLGGGLLDTVTGAGKTVGNVARTPFMWDKNSKGYYDTSALKDVGKSALQFGSGVANTIGGIGGLIGNTLNLPTKLFGTSEESVTTQNADNDPVTYAVKSTFGTPAATKNENNITPPADWINKDAYAKGQINNATNNIRNVEVSTGGFKNSVNKLRTANGNMSLVPGSQMDTIVKSVVRSQRNPEEESRTLPNSLTGTLGGLPTLGSPFRREPKTANDVYTAEPPATDSSKKDVEKIASNGTKYFPIRSDEEEAEAWEGVPREYQETPVTEEEQARIDAAEPSALSRFMRYASNIANPKKAILQRDAMVLNALTGADGGYTRNLLKTTFGPSSSFGDRVDAAKELATNFLEGDEGNFYSLLGAAGVDPETETGVKAKGWAANFLDEITDPVTLALLALSGGTAAASRPLLQYMGPPAVRNALVPYAENVARTGISNAARAGAKFIPGPGLALGSSLFNSLRRGANAVADWYNAPEESNDRINEAIDMARNDQNSEAMNMLYDAVNNE